MLPSVVKFKHNDEIIKEWLAYCFHINKEIQFLKVNKDIENNIANSFLSTNTLKIVQKIPASTFGLIPNDFKTSIQLFLSNNK